jgi:DNA-binding NtrC family response regulator
VNARAELMTGVRHALVLDCHGEVARALAAAHWPDWHFEWVQSAQAARRALPGHGELLGLAVFDQPGSVPVEEFQQIQGGAPLDWIALLDPQRMRDALFAQFVLRHFIDYHSLPLDLPRLQVSIGHAYGIARRRRELLAGEAQARTYGMIGTSPAMRELFRAIDKVVAVDAPVLLTGESGTGKELVARAIHAHSARSAGPFIAVNCGAFPSMLIQAELFGHERGAFTGAHQRKVGNIEAADRGVLFLDEIGDLPLEQQANLLRFLQEKTISRLGSIQRIAVDVRVIAATHVDLEKAVAAGRFRQDLFYRLNVLHLELPPLRERSGDLPLLAESVLHECAARNATPVRGFRIEALKAMGRHDWPGNVRELINRVQHAAIMSENRLLTPADLGLGRGGEALRTLDDARASIEKEVIVSSLRTNRNNVSQTARDLGISRVTLYRMISRLHIDL